MKADGKYEGKENFVPTTFKSVPPPMVIGYHLVMCLIMNSCRTRRKPRFQWSLTEGTRRRETTNRPIVVQGLENAMKWGTERRMGTRRRMISP